MENVNADLHAHLRMPENQNQFRYSPPDRAVKFLQGRLGAGGIIGIINTPEDRGNYELFIQTLPFGRSKAVIGDCFVYLPREDLLFLRGVETKTLDGPLTGLCVPKQTRFPEKETWQETAERIQEAGGLSILPRPYSTKGIISTLKADKQREEELLKLIEQIDAIEIFTGDRSYSERNSPPRERDTRPLTLYNSLKTNYPDTGAIGTSDSCSLTETGIVYTCLYLPEKVRELVNAGLIIKEVKNAVIRAKPQDISLPENRRLTNHLE